MNSGELKFVNSWSIIPAPSATSPPALSAIFSRLVSNCRVMALSLGRAAVEIEPGDISASLVKGTIAGRVALRGDRQAVSTGRLDTAVADGAVSIEVRNGLGTATVRIEHGHIGPGLIKRAVAVRIRLRSDREAIGAGRRDRAIHGGTVGIQIGNGQHGTAVGIGYAILRPGGHAVACRINDRRNSQAVRTRGGNGAVLERAILMEIGDRLGLAARPRGSGRMYQRPPNRSASSSTDPWRWSS